MKVYMIIRKDGLYEFYCSQAVDVVIVNHKGEQPQVGELESQPLNDMDDYDAIELGVRNG